MPEYTRHGEVEGANLSKEEIRAIDVDNLAALNRASGLPANPEIIKAQIRREKGEVRDKLAEDVLKRIKASNTGDDAPAREEDRRSARLGVRQARHHRAARLPLGHVPAAGGRSLRDEGADALGLLPKGWTADVHLA